MVTSTRIPYAEAARRGRRQDGIVHACLILIAELSILELSILLFRCSPDNGREGGSETATVAKFDVAKLGN
jgi:hypothetical protein